MVTLWVGALSFRTAVDQNAALQELVEGLEHLETQSPVLMLEEQFPVLLELVTPCPDNLIQRGGLRDSDRVGAPKTATASAG